MAAMDENEVWRAFGGHPEGLNAQEVSKIRAEHGDNQIPAQKPSPGGSTCGSATAIRSTCC